MNLYTMVTDLSSGLFSNASSLYLEFILKLETFGLTYSVYNLCQGHFFLVVGLFIQSSFQLYLEFDAYQF